MVKVERKVFETVRILSYWESTGGTEHFIQKQYEDLANLIGSYGGRVHGSQAYNGTDGDSIAVYFQLPIENKEEFLKEEKQ